VRGALAELAGAPAPALALGVAGLVPFVGLGALAGLQREICYAYWLATLSHYGAVILAFVGALHWGAALVSDAPGWRAWLRYGWSVVPALAAFASLQFPVWTALRLQAAMLVVCLVVDRVVVHAGGAPGWFVPLRALLTIVAAASLLLASAI
jgi:hypothetical protein